MTELREGFYVMAFRSTSHSIQTEKEASKQFNITVIPTPGELTNDCGLALKFNDDDIPKIKEFHKALTIPADLYFINNEKINGKRRIERI